MMEQNVATKQRAKRLAIDSKTNRTLLITADYVPPPTLALASTDDTPRRPHAGCRSYLRYRTDGAQACLQAYEHEPGKRGEQDPLYQLGFGGFFNEADPAGRARAPYHRDAKRHPRE